MRRWGALAILLPLAVPEARSQPAPEPPPRFSGTFLQLWADHAAWPDERWRELFSHFRALGLREVYVQWTRYDNISYAEPTSGRPAVLETLLRMAFDSGMTVHAGLAFDSGFWQSAHPGPGLPAYLEMIRTRSLETAGEVARRFGAHPAFAGWYISEEIDDLMWPAGEARTALWTHLAALCAGLERIAPGKPVTISGYAGARTGPAQLGAFWAETLDRAPLSTVMFQDGIGVGNLPLAYLKPYLEAMRQATDLKRRELRIIIEVFRQVDGTFNGRPFRALPVPFPLMLPQMQTAASYSRNGLVAFSIPEYMTPYGGAAAADSYASYVTWLRSPAQTQQVSRTFPGDEQ